MCASCNWRHNGDPKPYLKFMIERYGAEAIAELEVLRDSGGKVTDEELRQTLDRLRTMR